MDQTSKRIKVQTKKLKPTFTCGICHNILEQATAITECLHTYCWRCIYGKITEEDWSCCPVCKVDLGPKPLEKLRHDHLLEDLTQKLFPPKQKDEETESISSEASASSSTNM